MQSFIKAVEMHFKLLIQYKWAFFIYFAMRPIGILISIALFTSIYDYNGSDSIQGYSLNQMVWYFIATGFILVFITNFTDYRISRRIISGDLIVDLLRPMSYFWYEFSSVTASRMVGILMEFFPGLIVFSLMFYPKFLTPVALIKFVVLMILAFFMNYFINFLIGLLAFVLNNNSSITAIKGILISLAGGFFIPLEFFPPWLNRILDFLPFKYFTYWPIQIFLNKGDASDWNTFFMVLGAQVFWIAVFYLLCRLSWKNAIKRFCVAGG